MKKLLLLFTLALTTQMMNAQADALITTWVTANANETITLSAQPDAPNYIINWGDGSATDTYTATQNPSHIYINSGEHTISFTGTFPHLTFISQTKLKAVQQWGTQKWTSMADMFNGCFNLISFPTQVPDLSLCTNMLRMFFNADHFNQPINSWNVSNVKDMSYMFFDAYYFNQPIGSWNVGNVTNMHRMFDGAFTFNQPIDSWNVSKVTDMYAMFFSAPSFNQPIGSWNVGNVTNMHEMFFFAYAFNQPIGSWNVGKVTDMSNMFNGAHAFNQPIDSWNVSNVSNMSLMFRDASAFNQPIGSWNVSKVTDMSAMFAIAPTFNQPIGSWDVGNVSYMSNMFTLASAFNQPIGSWNVSKVADMTGMFRFATSFNQPIDPWNVSKVTNMSYMFNGATLFNQSIGSWNVSNVTDMRYMFTGVKLSTANYDNLLTGWAAKGTNGSVLKSGVPFDGGSSNYCNGLAARNFLINTYGWIITDAGVNCTGLGAEEFDKSRICLYPNPVSSVLNIKGDANLVNIPFKICDILGKIVLEGKLKGENIAINVEDLSNGNYFIQLGNDKASKFIKE